jgi:tetratricopeptide (TPR) repeat protein
MSQSRTLQDKLRDLQGSDFVGREDQLNIFRDNLGHNANEAQFHNIFNVFGQGGVGKTWLTRQFEQIAKASGAITAYVDEDAEEAPQAMFAISEQYAKQGHTLRTFDERYRVYRQKRQELEADSDAPHGFATLVGRTIAKSALQLVKDAPVAGLVVSLIDEGTVVDQAGQWADYVVKKIGNKDEIRLVLQPTEVLTPLLLDGLNEAGQSCLLTLLFDTYEYTGEFLDQWLRNMLAGKYGGVPISLVMVIAGRNELDKNIWSTYSALACSLPLEPFPEMVARDYLHRKGVTNDQVVELVVRLSGGLPLLLATLASQSPREPDEVANPSNTAVDRFLKWVDDPVKRNAALTAALPRYLNRDVLAQLVDDSNVDRLFEWLKKNPFMQERGGRWTYHSVVRGPMLRYEQQQSPQGWATLHAKLADYHEKLRSELRLDDTAGRRNRDWQRLTLEIVYHRLCSSSDSHFASALNGFLIMLEYPRQFARRWADAIYEAGNDTDDAQLMVWGKRLVDGLKDYDEDRFQSAASMFTALLDSDELEEPSRSIAFGWRGHVYFMANRHSDALKDLTESINIAQGNSVQWVDLAKVYKMRALIYSTEEKYPESVSDFDRAAKLEPNDPFLPILKMTMLMRQLSKEKGGSKIDIQDMSETLGSVSKALGSQAPQIIEYLQRAMAKLPTDTIERGVQTSLNSMGLDGEFAEHVIRRLSAIKGDAQTASVSMNVQALVAEASKNILDGEYDRALVICNDAIEQLGMTDADLYFMRGQVYYRLRMYNQALSDLSFALEQLPMGILFEMRGKTYRQMGKYEEALSDFNTAIGKMPGSAVPLAGRAKTYFSMRRYAEALDDYNHALQIDPSNAWYSYSRFLVHKVRDEEADARADLSNAIELAEKSCQPNAKDRGKRLDLALYYLSSGDYKKAYDLYQQALSSNASPVLIMQGLEDLDELLSVIPGHQEAERMRVLLKGAPNQ